MRSLEKLAIKRIGELACEAADLTTSATVEESAQKKMAMDNSRTDGFPSQIGRRLREIGAWASALTERE